MTGSFVHVIDDIAARRQARLKLTTPFPPQVQFLQQRGKASKLPNAANHRQSSTSRHQTGVVLGIDLTHLSQLHESSLSITNTT
jgi:hypothetical protein